MGWFKKLKKTLVKVARGGLAVATGGASERVIQTAKALGEYVHPSKRAAQVKAVGGVTTPRVHALVAKAGGKAQSAVAAVKKRVPLPVKAKRAAERAVKAAVAVEKHVEAKVAKGGIASKAALMKQIGTDWRALSAEQKSAAGGWQSYVTGRMRAGR